MISSCKAPVACPFSGLVFWAAVFEHCLARVGFISVVKALPMSSCFSDDEEVKAASLRTCSGHRESFPIFSCSRVFCPGARLMRLQWTSRGNAEHSAVYFCLRRFCRRR